MQELCTTAVQIGFQMDPDGVLEITVRKLNDEDVSLKKPSLIKRTPGI